MMLLLFPSSIILLLILNYASTSSASTPYDNMRRINGIPSTYWMAVTSSANGKILAASIKGSSNTGVYVSTNAGSSWSLSPDLPTAVTYGSVSMSSDGSRITTVVGFTAAIYTSSNAGSTWTRTSYAPNANPDQPSKPFYFDVALSSDGMTQVVVSYEGGMYISTDGGYKWDLLSSAPSSTWYSCAISGDGRTIIAVDNGDDNDAGGKIYMSSDMGTTFTTAAVPELFWRGVACSDDASVIVAVSFLVGFVYVSRDGGRLWTMVDLPDGDWRGLDTTADGKIMGAVVSGGGVFISTDFGTTFAATSAPVNTWVSLAFTANGTSYLLSGDNALWLTYYDTSFVPPPSTALSGGAIFGIVVGALIFCSLVVFFFRRRISGKSKKLTDRDGGGRRGY